jgi:hypothetical protein
MKAEIRNSLPSVPVANATPVARAFRKPVRITVTINHATYQELENRSTQEGRSISNLAAYLLEVSLLVSKT